MTAGLSNPGRRNLLKRALALPLASTVTRVGGVSLLGLGASAISPAFAAADCTVGGPRSLVCVFLAGGADSFNLFVPTDNRYDEYRATRNELAVAEADLLEVNDAGQGAFAFHRQLDSFHALYNSNQLAVVSNVGPLLRPTTQADYRNRIALPESLFAHDAQQKLWQTSAGRVSGTDGFGWGGAIAEQIAACNLGAGVGGAFSIAGSNAFQSDRSAQYISLSPNADVQRMYGLDPSVARWIPEQSRNSVAAKLAQLLSNAQLPEQPLMLQEAGGHIARAQVATEQLQGALEEFSFSQWEPNPSNKLEKQLHLVARLIQARSSLNMERQIFFVRMGGWDTHSNQNERMPLLLGELNQAISQFHSALVSTSLIDSVTTFTASDFGRTLTSNGNGTDHGWGGHNFVFGGAVRGGQVFGQIPSYSMTNNQDDAGDENGGFAGRIIPTQSVNQYGATLARWMGVPDAELPSIFPDLANFATSDLGFMA